MRIVNPFKQYPKMTIWLTIILAGVVYNSPAMVEKAFPPLNAVLHSEINNGTDAEYQMTKVVQDIKKWNTAVVSIKGQGLPELRAVLVENRPVLVDGRQRLDLFRDAWRAELATRTPPDACKQIITDMDRSFHNYFDTEEQMVNAIEFVDFKDPQAMRTFRAKLDELQPIEDGDTEALDTWEKHWQANPNVCAGY